MNDNVLIVRNYINKEVLRKTPVIGFPVLEIFGDKGMYGKKLLEKLFLEDKIQEQYEYIILIDEDCFVYNSSTLLNIINYMDENDYDICGVPDGGTSRVRVHRSDVPNTFFCIFKCKKIINISKTNYSKYQVPCNLYNSTKNIRCDNFEEYYKMLCYLRYCLNMSFLPLTDVYEDDERATIISFNSEKVCIHCWYSRLYKKNNKVKERINRILEKAKADNESNNIYNT